MCGGTQRHQKGCDANLLSCSLDRSSVVITLASLQRSAHGLALFRCQPFDRTPEFVENVERRALLPLLDVNLGAPVKG